eukprot:scaffold109105_cov63-Phaeocystis_antarctica.AAC.1
MGGWLLEAAIGGGYWRLEHLRQWAGALRRHRSRAGALLGAERGRAGERARQLLLLQELLEARLVELDQDHVGPRILDELCHFTQLLPAGRVHRADDAERACRARDTAHTRERLDAPARCCAAEQHREAQAASPRTRHRSDVADGARSSDSGRGRCPEERRVGAGPRDRVGSRTSLSI